MEEQRKLKADRAKRSGNNKSGLNNAERDERENDPHFQFLKVQQNTDGAAEAAKKLEEGKRLAREKEEKEKEEKKQAESAKRQKRRTTMKKTRPSIFGDFSSKKRGTNLLTGGKNMGSFNEMEDGGEETDDDASSRMSSATDASMLDSPVTDNSRTSSLSNASSIAEAKPTSPSRKKMSRRQSAKASDTNWAIKSIRSESGYQEIHSDRESSIIGKAPSSTGSPENRDSSNSLASHNAPLFVKRRGSSKFGNDGIIEEGEEEGEEGEGVRGGIEHLDLSAESKQSQVEQPPIPPPAVAAAVSAKINKNDAVKFNVEVLKMSMFINDASTEENRKGWYYANAEGGEEGPFLSIWMHSWLSDKSLHSDTMVRLGDGETFVKLSSLIHNCDVVSIDDENPFDLTMNDDFWAIISHSMAALK